MYLKSCLILALALMMAPSSAHPQSQLNPPADTFEIPGADPSFVGTWCGHDQIVAYETEPVVPGLRATLRAKWKCYAFVRGNDGGVVLVNRLNRTPAMHLVSESAHAVTAREISSTWIIELKDPQARTTTTITFKLTSPDRIRTTRMLWSSITAPFNQTETLKYAGDLHPAVPGEAEAYEAALRRSAGAGE
jgi:hypothetical protein